MGLNIRKRSKRKPVGQEQAANNGDEVSIDGTSIATNRSNMSARSVRDKVKGAMTSPIERRRRRKLFLQEQKLNAEEERRKANIAPKAPTHEDQERYEQLQNRRQNLLGLDDPSGSALLEAQSFSTRRFNAGNVYVNMLVETLTKLMSMRQNKHLEILWHLAVLFFVYDDNVTDKLMHLDQNMLPIIFFLCMIVFVNVFRGVSLHVMEALEQASSVQVFQNMVLFVSRHTKIVAAVFYVACWVVCGLIEIVSRTLLSSDGDGDAANAIASVLVVPDDEGFAEEISALEESSFWMDLQFGILDRAKVVLRYSASLAVVVLVLGEIVAKHYG
eukprot:CAMPEP_0116016204 /NCGR_PEP_ID=MMETSP0321-20121206/7323_1 /TAXON_ID=163516 /ORGANISM="Leptocylindrus danicus var. danicus, Strain B650" /LENGTH=329 /DNA_ID=CAMNT_0003486181 /DNA_START=14 /DNA_END=999 /DNA_ORIENTATION=-